MCHQDPIPLVQDEMARLREPPQATPDGIRPERELLAHLTDVGRAPLGDERVIHD